MPISGKIMGRKFCKLKNYNLLAYQVQFLLIATPNLLKTGLKFVWLGAVEAQNGLYSIETV